MRTLTALLAAAAITGGCATPPAPPSVDDSVRRPINNPQMIELQRCSGELSATRIALTEAAHRANRSVAGASAQAMEAAQRAADNCPRLPAIADKISADKIGADKISANQVFVVPFKLGSASLDLEPEQASRLTKAAAAAQLVVVRGRTDAPADSLSETALAKRRAQAAGEFLVLRAGVARERLRLQWQGAGDALEPDDSAVQRQRNRRVEVELYATAPRTELLANAAQ